MVVPVTVLDVHGNARAPAPGELAVSFVSSRMAPVVGAGIVPTDASTGRTFATASLTRADRTHPSRRLPHGALVPGSRSFELVTVAGSAHPPSSRISGAGVHSGGVSGESREVYVDIRDRYGNPIVDASGIAASGLSATVTVRVRVPANATRDNDGGYVPVTSQSLENVAMTFADGKFAAGYVGDVPGAYGVYVNVTATDGDPGDGSSSDRACLFKFLGLELLPRRANASTTELISADLSLAAGDAGRVRLRLRDSANATVGASNAGDAVAVTLTHASGGDAVLGTHVGTPQPVNWHPRRACGRTDDTETAFSYAPTLAGNYTLDVRVNGERVVVASGTNGDVQFVVVVARGDGATRSGFGVASVVTGGGTGRARRASRDFVSLDATRTETSARTRTATTWPSPRRSDRKVTGSIPRTTERADPRTRTSPPRSPPLT